MTKIRIGRVLIVAAAAVLFFTASFLGSAPFFNPPRPALAATYGQDYNSPTNNWWCEVLNTPVNSGVSIHGSTFGEVVEFQVKAVCQSRAGVTTQPIYAEGTTFGEYTNGSHWSRMATSGLKDVRMPEGVWVNLPPAYASCNTLGSTHGLRAGWTGMFYSWGDAGVTATITERQTNPLGVRYSNCPVSTIAKVRGTMARPDPMYVHGVLAVKVLGPMKRPDPMYAS